MIRVLVVDDQSAIRVGLTMRLSVEPDLEVVGEASDGEQAVSLAAELQPDVVIMEIDLPRLDGLAATRAIGEVAPKTRVIILTMHGGMAVQAEAAARGAARLVEKAAGEAALLATIRDVARSSNSANGDERVL